MPKVKEILKKVRKIEIKTKKLVDGLVYGEYHSIFKGQGIEFSEVREYNPGDDVRQIDWNVTARMNRPYIKEFIEERDNNMYIIFDLSKSGDFGNKIEKREKAIEVAATLMMSALKNNDKIGLVIFTENVEKFIPARKGRKHLLKMIREMAYYEPENSGTNMQNALDWINKVLRKKSIVFLISDFLCEDNYSKALSILNRKHDVIAVRIFDNREIEIPEMGYLYLEDEETGEQVLVNTNDKKFVESYKKIINHENKVIAKMLKRNKVDIFEVNTEEEIEVPLKKFFKSRMIR